MTRCVICCRDTHTPAMCSPPLVLLPRPLSFIIRARARTSIFDDDRYQGDFSCGARIMPYDTLRNATISLTRISYRRRKTATRLVIWRFVQLGRKHMQRVCCAQIRRVAGLVVEKLYILRYYILEILNTCARIEKHVRYSRYLYGGY